MAKIKIDKWDVYVGIFLTILFILWYFSDQNQEVTAPTTAAQPTATPSNTNTRPDFISVSLGDYASWGSFKENTQLGSMKYQISGVTLVIHDSIWVESEKSYPYCLLFLRGNGVREMLPVNSCRVISEDEVKSLSDSAVVTASGTTYWKPRYCIEEGSEYSVTDSYVVSVEPFNETNNTSRTYWWWVAFIFATALCIGAVFLVYGGVTDCEISMIVIGAFIIILAGYWISYLFS